MKTALELRRSYLCNSLQGQVLHNRAAEAIVNMLQAHGERSMPLYTCYNDQVYEILRAHGYTVTPPRTCIIGREGDETIIPGSISF